MITFTCDYCGEKINDFKDVCKLEIKEVAMEGRFELTTSERIQKTSMIIHTHDACCLKMFERIKRIKEETK